MVTLAMKFLTLCWSILHVLVSCDGFWLEEPVIATPMGKLIGARMYSASGRRFLSFRGIPYALAPLGRLRFKVTATNLSLTILVQIAITNRIIIFDGTLNND